MFIFLWFIDNLENEAEIKIYKFPISRLCKPYIPDRAYGLQKPLAFLQSLLHAVQTKWPGIPGLPQTWLNSFSKFFSHSATKIIWP